MPRRPRTNNGHVELNSTIPIQPNGATSPIADALDKNKQATEDVKKAADDLAVVHAVLDTKLARTRATATSPEQSPKPTRSRSASPSRPKKLDEVNETLERETRRQP